MKREEAQYPFRATSGPVKRFFILYTGELTSVINIIPICDWDEFIYILLNSFFYIPCVFEIKLNYNLKSTEGISEPFFYIPCVFEIKKCNLKSTEGISDPDKHFNIEEAQYHFRVTYCPVKSFFYSIHRRTHQSNKYY